MGHLSATDWIAVFSIAAPLIAKAFSDWQANATANHNLKLARIVGMAGREAATIDKTLQAIPPGGDIKLTEKELISSSAALILNEMGSTSSAVGADEAKISTIVQGELDKITQTRPAVVVAPPADSSVHIVS